ncbi:MAG: CDP-archaeol synthase [Syntrophobacteraceae bacterium]
MSLFFKMLVLLWLVNFAPPLLAHFLGERWNAPVDGNRAWRDGRPLFGPHKTIRGLASSLLAGTLAGWLLGLTGWIGALTAVLSMAGDLLSSFIKRRLSLPSGDVSPGLDQVFEGAFPILLLGLTFDLGRWTQAALLLVFGLAALAGSWFFKRILRMEPFESYPRAINTRVRLRELRSCQITSNPFHYVVNLGDAIYYHVFMNGIFRLLGLYERGKRNALRIITSEVAFTSPDLPRSFDGYRILFLSDLHLDGLDGLTETLQPIVGSLPADLCIIGGDLRMQKFGPFDEALSRFRALLPHIRVRDGIYGILGNHDCTEIIEPLTQDGVGYLVNESAAIERNGERIWLIGADDPHMYKCHDLGKAFQDVPADGFRILAAHSNEIYREAARFRPHLYLCGHTHAGQIQLPRFGPIFTHSSAPRRFCYGPWVHETMQGFTSCGAGVSGIPVRFASRGEVVLLTLKRGDSVSCSVSVHENG